MVSESQFSMWRAVIALIHADGVVTPQEVSFINGYLDKISLSPEQHDQILEDFRLPQDPHEMFLNIDEESDREKFFTMARAICWCDGDFDRQEQLIIRNLERLHNDVALSNLLEKSRDHMNEVMLDANQWSGRQKQPNVLERLTSLLQKEKQTS